MAIKKKGPVKISPLAIETVSLGALKPWEKNPRKGHAVDGIAKSIEAYGYVSPIIVQKGTYRILAGHGRYQALKNLGANKIPVVVVDLSDRAGDEYTVADNRFTDLSEFDMTALADQLKDYTLSQAEQIGFSEEQLREILSEESEDGQLKDIPTDVPPKMTWILIGIPTVRYGEIAFDVEKVSAIEGTVVETTSNDGN